MISAGLRGLTGSNALADATDAAAVTMSTFLTGGDDGYDAPELSGVDRQRLEEREWRARYEEAVQAHEKELGAANAREQQLAVDLQRQTDRALKAEASASKAVAEIAQVKTAHAKALEAVAADREEERRTARDSSAALEAALQQQLAAVGSRAAELQAALDVEKQQVDAITEAKSVMRTKLAQAQQQSATLQAAAQAVPPLRRQCFALRQALSVLTSEQRTCAGAFTDGITQVQQALTHGEQLQSRLLTDAEAKATALRHEICTANREAASEFDGYQGKLDELRRRLVEVDNEKCTAKTRASELERECAALRQRLMEVERRANERVLFTSHVGRKLVLSGCVLANVRACVHWAALIGGAVAGARCASQASKVVRMLDELESREQQCTADFERVRELSDRVQVGAVFPHGGFAAFGALSSSTFPPVPPSLPLSVPTCLCVCLYLTPFLPLLRARSLSLSLSLSASYAKRNCTPYRHGCPQQQQTLDEVPVCVCVRSQDRENALLASKLDASAQSANTTSNTTSRFKPRGSSRGGAVRRPSLSGSGEAAGGSKGTGSAVGRRAGTASTGRGGGKAVGARR
eukprot:COSAG05_NODE_955_length_6434_cov_15.147119_5_plen_578_part_00